MEEEIERIWYQLSEKNKEIRKLEEKMKDNDYSTELRVISLRLRAIIDYLDVEFREEWVEDCSYIPPEPRKIRRLIAIKRSALKTK